MQDFKSKVGTGTELQQENWNWEILVLRVDTHCLEYNYCLHGK